MLSTTLKTDCYNLFQEYRNSYSNDLESMALAYKMNVKTLWSLINAGRMFGIEENKEQSFEQLVDEFDLDTLDVYESMQYEKMLAHSNKQEILTILINNVEGDYSQLSDGLRAIAIKEMH